MVTIQIKSKLRSLWAKTEQKKEHYQQEGRREYAKITGSHYFHRSLSMIQSKLTYELKQIVNIQLT